MLKSFTEAEQGGAGSTSDGRYRGETDATIGGLRTIAINVLMSAGYGVSQSWKHGSGEPPQGHSLSYIETVSVVVHNYLVAALVPARLLRLPVMPTSLRKLGAAVFDFPARTKEMVEKERKATGLLRSNMMSALVKASDDEKNPARKDAKSRLHMSEDEMIGNLYQFTIAGFDTTANTMAYAVTILAIHIEWQDWIIEEIDQVAIFYADLDYGRTFPALTRCLALMVSLGLNEGDMELSKISGSMKLCAFTPPSPTSRESRKSRSTSPRLLRPSMFLQIRRFSSAAPPCMWTQRYGDLMRSPSVPLAGYQTSLKWSLSRGRSFHGLAVLEHAPASKCRRSSLWPLYRPSFGPGE